MEKTNNHINFAFWGTPEIASQTLEILANNDYLPRIIITSLDKRSGRGMHLLPSPVSIWADEHHIECLKPEKIDFVLADKLKKLSIDLSIVVAFGKILPEEIISLPSFKTINIHYSLLPKYRGASPVEQAILNGDTFTGVSIQQMNFKLDSGPIITEEKVEIESTETKIELLGKLIKIGGKLLVKILPYIFNKNIHLKEQDDSLATFCKKIKKEDGQLDLNDKALTNYNKYRAFRGWPGVFFIKNIKGNNIRVKINEAKYTDGSFVIKKVTPESKKEMNYTDFLKFNI